jgi:di/tricarboxylate transporter
MPSTILTPSRPILSIANLGLVLAIAALVAVMLLPTPEGLPVAGQRMLAILAFAVIVWMTEALDYAVSAIVVAALMAFPAPIHLHQSTLVAPCLDRDQRFAFKPE